MVTEAGYTDLSEEKRQLAGVVAGLSSGDASPGPMYPDLSEEQRREVAEAEAEEQEEKERLAAQLGVGGRPAQPSAPASPGEGEARSVT